MRKSDSQMTEMVTKIEKIIKNSKMQYSDLRTTLTARAELYRMGIGQILDRQKSAAIYQWQISEYQWQISQVRWCDIGECCRFEANRPNNTRISFYIDKFRPDGAETALFLPGEKLKVGDPGDLYVKRHRNFAELGAWIVHLQGTGFMRFPFLWPPNEEKLDTDPVLRIIDNMSDISGGACLSQHLHRSEYIAIKDGDARELIHKCDCQLYRGSGYGLKKFGYEPNIGMQIVKTRQGDRYLLVGPGDNFKLNRRKTDLALRLRVKLQLRATVQGEAVKNNSVALVSGNLDTHSDVAYHIAAHVVDAMGV
jgi:hypothetical protein